MGNPKQSQANQSASSRVSLWSVECSDLVVPCTWLQLRSCVHLCQSKLMEQSSKQHLNARKSLHSRATLWPICSQFPIFTDNWI